MRVIDALIRREWLKSLSSRAEEQGHRVVILNEGERVFVRIICAGGDTDEVLSDLREQIRDSGVCEEHYTVLEPVALEPRAEEGDASDSNDEAVAGTDEIESFVEEGARFSRTFVVLSTLAGVIAGAALLRDNTAALVGSMVLAPLAKPIALVGVAISLGRPAKAIRASLWLSVSLLISATAATLVTLLTPAVPVTHLVESRTGTSPFDLVVAMAAGLAMAYVLLKRDAMSFVGIVVAASLMPVAAVLGVGVAIGRFELVLGAVFTLVSNISGIVLGLLVGLRVESLRSHDPRRELLAAKLTKQSLVVGAGVVLALLGVSAWSHYKGLQTTSFSTKLQDALVKIPPLGLTQTTEGAYVILVPAGQREQALRSLGDLVRGTKHTVLISEAYPVLTDAGSSQAEK